MDGMLYGVGLGRHYAPPDEYKHVRESIFFSFPIVSHNHTTPAEQILTSTVEGLLRDSSGKHDTEDGWNFVRTKQGVKGKMPFLFGWFECLVLMFGRVKFFLASASKERPKG